MRGLAAAFLIFVATPALAGSGFGHDRMPLPPAAPAFETADGDPYGKMAKDYGPPERETDLQRFAASFGAGRNNGHSDLFRYALEHDEAGEPVQGPAVAGTFSGGAAQLQLRWNTSE